MTTMVMDTCIKISQRAFFYDTGDFEIQYQIISYFSAVPSFSFDEQSVPDRKLRHIQPLP